MGVVEMSLVFIVENIICLLDSLEFDLGGLALGFGNFVGVACKSGLL